MAHDSKTNPLLIAMFSLIGVILGATLQYFITLKTEKEKLWADLRTKTYIQYVENTSKLNVLEDKAKQAEAKSLRNSARFLIALYGSKDVIEQMKKYARWEDNRPQTGSPQEEEFKKSSLILFNAMRNELMPSNERVDVEALRPILFPSELHGPKLQETTPPAAR